MQVERLTELFAVRITPGLRQALQCKAAQMRLRPADIGRMALAEAVRDVDPNPAAEQAEQREGGGDE